MQEVLQQQRSGQLTGVRPYGRQAGRGGLGRETLLSMSAKPPGCPGITKEAWQKLSWLDNCKGVSSQGDRNPASFGDRGQKDNMSLILFSSYSLITNIWPYNKFFSILWYLRKSSVSAREGNFLFNPSSPARSPSI